MRTLVFIPLLISISFWLKPLHANESVSLCDRSQTMLRALSQQIMNFDCKTDDGNSISRGNGLLLLDFKNQDPPVCGDFAGFGGLVVLEIRGLSGEIPECMLSELDNLKSLTIAKGNVTTLPEKLFSKMKRLTFLDVKDTQIARLPDNIFSGLDSLRSLNLNRNRLESIDNLHLERLPNLLHLTVDNNRLTSVPVETLRAGNLRTYQYLENPFIGDLLNFQGQSIPDVRNLNVCQRTARVRAVLEEKFEKKCEHIQPLDLELALDLKILFTNDDQMSCEDLKGLTNLRRLDIFGYRGDWRDCFFKHNQNLLELVVERSSIDSESLTLGYLKNLLRLRFSSVTFKNLTRDFFTSTPQLRSLTFERSFIDFDDPIVRDGDLFESLKSLKHLELTDLKLTELPENIFSRQLGLISLTLNHNRIGTLSRAHFRNLKNLRSLEVAFNRLQVLPSDLLHDLGDLDFLNLEGNSISEIPEHFFSRQIRLSKVRLGASIQKIPDYSFVNAGNITSVDVGLSSIGNVPSRRLTDTSKAAFKGVPQVIGLPESFGSDPDDEWEAR